MTGRSAAKVHWRSEGAFSRGTLVRGPVAHRSVAERTIVRGTVVHGTIVPGTAARKYVSSYPHAVLDVKKRAGQRKKIVRSTRPTAKTARKRIKMNVKSAAGVMVYKMNEAKSKSWLSIPAAISVSLVFACAMSLAGICAAEFNAKFELEQLRADFKEIQEANLITEAEIAKSYDLEEIERVAIAKLGMSKPKAHQIVRVNAPAKSYAVDFTDKTDSDGENKGLWSILTDAFASVFK